MQASPNVTSLIATLVAPHGEVAALDDAARQLSAALATPSMQTPLGKRARDVTFRGSLEQLDDLRRAAAEALAHLPVDIVLQPAEGRRKQLLIADMDSTIIGQECVDELAGALGLREQISAITERAMRGELAFEPALRERVHLLAGFPVAGVERLLDEVITLNAGARSLVTTMAAHGAHTALVSGGFTLFTQAIAERAGFAEHRANLLERDADTLTGAVREPILGREAKRSALWEMTTARGLTSGQALAVGDGANDLAMIEAAGLGVAYRAKPIVAAAADAHLAHADLTALLYAQGYREDEILPDT